MSKINLENVWKRFDSKVAVAGVSFEIPPGKVFGLLGPNGAGKTTLIRMMMDIIKPDSGTILFDGHVLTTKDKDRITYLPEERGLYRKEKVRDVLEYFGELKGLSRQNSRARTIEYLTKLDMIEVHQKKIEELSKGNQQKIQIAATLISDPQVVILDEPFTGLDPLNVRVTKSLLAEEGRKGKTVLFSTHQMNQVEELCDELLMINLGKQVLYGRLEDILQRYSEPALLVECSPLDGTIPEIERVTMEGKLRKIYPKPGIAPHTVLKSMIDRGIQIERFQKASTPLEEIFIKVAQESSREAEQ
ncbi:MAG TPA: ATP-binding cassette domain-containing protein [Acidobacteriota bacterium]|nr:ATP-binding cassette domain-containing protein [Acidobacteriota bacterium]